MVSRVRQVKPNPKKIVPHTVKREVALSLGSRPEEKGGDYFTHPI